MRKRCIRSARWRRWCAQGGELQHVKPHGMLYNQAKIRSLLTLSPKRYMTLTRVWCW